VVEELIEEEFFMAIGGNIKKGNVTLIKQL
jgi:hypothetical protein